MKIHRRSNILFFLLQSLLLLLFQVNCIDTEITSFLKPQHEKDIEILNSAPGSFETTFNFDNVERRLATFDPFICASNENEVCTTCQGNDIYFGKRDIRGHILSFFEMVSFNYALKLSVTDEEPCTRFNIPPDPLPRVVKQCYCAPSNFTFTLFPTFSPTPFPTTSPQPELSQSPTSSPMTQSFSPTSGPTKSPVATTLSPTMSPTTGSPTSITQSPTLSPIQTQSPTLSPIQTQSPTLSPFQTQSPTLSPIQTQSPTKSPTESPSPLNFTESPTKSPELNVTESPVIFNPTPSPTDFRNTQPPVASALTDNSNQLIYVLAPLSALLLCCMLIIVARAPKTRQKQGRTDLSLDTIYYSPTDKTLNVAADAVDTAEVTKSHRWPKHAVFSSNRMKSSRTTRVSENLIEENPRLSSEQLKSMSSKNVNLLQNKASLSRSDSKKYRKDSRKVKNPKFGPSTFGIEKQKVSSRSLRKQKGSFIEAENGKDENLLSLRRPASSSSTTTLNEELGLKTNEVASSDEFARLSFTRGVSKAKDSGNDYGFSAKKRIRPEHDSVPTNVNLTNSSGGTDNSKNSSSIDTIRAEMNTSEEEEGNNKRTKKGAQIDKII